MTKVFNPVEKPPFEPSCIKPFSTSKGTAENATIRVFVRLMTIAVIPFNISFETADTRKRIKEKRGLHDEKR